MRELEARTLVVVRSSRTNDGRRTGERSRLAAVPFRSTVARAVRYLRARPRRRASRSRFSTKRSERGPLRRRRRRRRHSAASPSAWRDGRGKPTGRPVGRFQCAALAVGNRRWRSARRRRRHVPGTHQYTQHTRGHVRPHPSRPQPFFYNNIIF